MQRKLSEIADIPIKIQSTLIEISKKFETILPSEEPEINYQILSETDQTESDNYDDEDEEFENHALDSLSLDYKNEDDENRQGLLRDFFENDSNNSCETDLSQSEDEIEEIEVVPEVPRELTEEEKLKIEKQLKVGGKKQQKNV